MIKWGIIGCGDVTEVKSGPAFNKVRDSSLVAVMRRDGAKAKDYAARHGVPAWYDDAYQLISDPEVNAIYVATPPSSHEEYVIAALRAGKPVYVEKPMSTQVEDCIRMRDVAASTGVKLTVAHYRRALPMFMKVKQLVDEHEVGDVRTIILKTLQPALQPATRNLQPDLLQPAARKPQPDSLQPATSNLQPDSLQPATSNLQPESLQPATRNLQPENWRVDPKISGLGGLFYDLAPHQLDLMVHFFGPVAECYGVSANQAALYIAKDIVSGNIRFENNIIFSGTWCFTVAEELKEDKCEIIGSTGKITFPVFGNKITIQKGNDIQESIFEHPKHIQQPMIEQIVNYFSGSGTNPCSADQAIESMKLMEKFTTGK
jgi:predicted dehydrogenase